MIYKSARIIADTFDDSMPIADRNRLAALISLDIAPLVEAAQHTQMLRMRSMPTPFGHNCRWCGDCSERVKTELREALEKILL